MHLKASNVKTSVTTYIHATTLYSRKTYIHASADNMVGHKGSDGFGKPALILKIRDRKIIYGNC